MATLKDKLVEAAEDGSLLTLGLVGLVAVAGEVARMRRGSGAIFEFEQVGMAGTQLADGKTSRAGEALANWRWHNKPKYKDDPIRSRFGPASSTRLSSKRYR
jgi:hypothetical protein